MSVVVFYVSGHAFNYLLLITTNHMVQPDIFGLYYICISMINVLVTPGLTVVWSLAQHLSVVAAIHPTVVVVAEFWRSLRKLLALGGLVAAIVASALSLLGQLIGLDSLVVILLIPVVALASLAVEFTRAAFQALQRFHWFSTSWVLWCALQYGFAIAGLLLIGTVWAGLLGLLIAAIVTAAGASWALGPSEAMPPIGERAPTEEASLIAVKGLIPLIAGYGLYTLLVNTDVLLAYLLLPREQVAVYVASSILPKAIVTATLPVAQVLMPVAIARASAAQSTRLYVLKALAAATSLAAAGVLVLKFGEGYACNSRFGLRYCDSELMMILAVAAVPLCALRVLVIGSLVHALNWRPLLQFVGVALVALLACLWHSSPEALAVIYVCICAGILVLYVAVGFLKT